MSEETNVSFQRKFKLCQNAIRYLVREFEASFITFLKFSCFPFYLGNGFKFPHITLPSLLKKVNTFRTFLPEISHRRRFIIRDPVID